MKKLLLGAIMLSSLTAQAKEVSLSCTYSYSNKEVVADFIFNSDPTSMQGTFKGDRVTLSNFGEFYTVDSFGTGYHFRLNRQTLELSGISFKEGLGFIPDDIKGQCHISESKNKI